MAKKLSEVIKKLEDKEAIEDYYLHHEYYTGELQLNIEFKNDIADDILQKNIKENKDSCAFWE